MKLIKLPLICLSFVFACAALFARAPELLEIKSDAMQKIVKNFIILPEGHAKGGEEYPVVYILHGYSDNHEKWAAMRADLPDVATKMGVIFVMPDGGKSWYFDSPANPQSKYETYVAKELVSYVDANFSTRKDRKGRAITGNSMGGHGALWLAMRNPEVFGACGSQSGGVDFRPFPKRWSLKDNLGEYEKNKDLWTKHTIMGNLDKLKAANLSIIIDCGSDDFFFGVNEALHAEMLRKKIPHTYIVSPGGHSWKYWRNSLDYQLLFFDKAFKSK